MESEVRLVGSRRVGRVLSLPPRLAADLMDSRLLGPVHVADAARYVRADALDELASRPELTGPHPDAMVLRVNAAVRDERDRPFVGWRADLPLAQRRAGVTGFWTLSDARASQVCDERWPIVVTLRGFVVDVFAARKFTRTDRGILFDPAEIDPHPFAGTVMRLGGGGALKWLLKRS